MKYLIISRGALSLFSVWHLGLSPSVEKVYFCPMDLDMKQVGMNLNEMKGWEKLEMVFDPFKVLKDVKKEDMIIFIDDVGLGPMGDHLREDGWKVVGGTEFTDKIEADRTFATNLMSKFMKVPPSTTFGDFEAGINFLKSQEPEARFVFKPNDEAVPKEFTYVSKDVDDMLEFIKEAKGEWKWKPSFQLQEFIKGVEVSFSCYINQKGEYLPNSHIFYFENKAFMNDDVGPATGGMIAAQFCRGLEGQFFDIFKKFQPYLNKANYSGQIDINCIVSDEDHQPYFLEFCGRVGYPSFEMDITLLEESGHELHHLLKALAEGETPTLWDTDHIAVVAAVFLKGSKEELSGKPMSWDKKWDRYFFPYLIKYDPKIKKVVQTGLSDEVLTVTCGDKTLDGAVQMLYETYMPTLKLTGKMYRTDLGKSAKERMKKLKEWGIL